MLKYKPQGIYWPPAQGLSGGEEEFLFLVLRARFACELADVFEENKKKNKTYVYRLALDFIYPA